jgi:hypothetical protein
MKSKRRLPFDPKVFQSKVNGGRAISKYLKDELVFTQGEPADSVFYIQSGKVKKTVVSEQGKEAVVALLGAGDFFLGRNPLWAPDHTRPYRAGTAGYVYRYDSRRIGQPSRDRKSCAYGSGRQLFGGGRKGISRRHIVRATQQPYL